MIVVVNYTVMSGQVARFYNSESEIVFSEPAVSASRWGVMGHGGRIEREAFEAAWAAFERLKRGEDVRDIATHGDWMNLSPRFWEEK